MILAFVASIFAYIAALIIFNLSNRDEHYSPKGNALVLDTETTGLPSDSSNARLVQITWILIKPSGEKIDEKTFIVKPIGFNIPKKSIEIHGIDNKTAMKRGEDIVNVLKLLKEDLSNSTYVVAHNIEFDISVLKSEAKNNNIELGLVEKSMVCTMKESAEFCEINGKNDYKWPTLSELHNVLFDERIEASHDSQRDAAICVKCFKELYNRRVINLD